MYIDILDALERFDVCHQTHTRHHYYHIIWYSQFCSSMLKEFRALLRLLEVLVVAVSIRP